MRNSYFLNYWHICSYKNAWKDILSLTGQVEEFNDYFREQGKYIAIMFSKCWLSFKKYYLCETKIIFKHVIIS